MMFSAEPVGGRTASVSLGDTFSNLEKIQKAPLENLIGKEDWTVLRLGIWTTPGIWLVSSEKKQFLETKMTLERK